MIMGLDMYAYSASADQFTDKDQVDVSLKGKNTSKIFYWRKFNALHGWMESLYRHKGGTEVFNCTTVRLMPEDIDSLEKAFKATKANEEGGLKPTSGFFFGAETIYPEDLETLEKFIVLCGESFDANEAVFYTSWW